MTLALEKDSIRRCYGLSRLYLLFVVVIALDVSLRRPELCVGRVVMEVRGAYFQPAFRPVLPKVAIGIPALLTVVAGG